MNGRLTHEEMEVLITADALDGLDADERAFLLAELARHGPDCPECLRLMTVYSEVAGRLALMISPVAMSSQAEERLLSAARARPGTAPGAPMLPVDGPSQPPPGGALRQRVTPNRRWLVAAAAAAALAVLAGFVGYRVAPRPKGAEEQFLAFVAQPDARIVAFPTTGDRTLAVAFRPGQTQGWIVGTNLPTPPGGKVYELWFQPDPSAGVHPAGTFEPKDGIVLARATLGPAFTALAVSIEPPGGSNQPTLPPVYQAAVTA
jgi:hypothetical protein